MAQSCGLNTCYRCDKEIEGVEELSIEHKEAWQQAKDPKESFFDLNNIAFSHLDCNCKDRIIPNKGQRAPHGTRTCYIDQGCRCEKCREVEKIYRRKWRGTREH